MLFNKACNFIIDAIEDAEKSQQARNGTGSIAGTTTSSQVSDRALSRYSTSNYTAPSYSLSATFPPIIGNPTAWTKLTQDNLSFSVNVPSGAMLCSPCDATTLCVYIPNTPGPMGSNTLIAVFPMYSQSTANDWIQRQRGSFPNRAWQQCYHISSEESPSFPGIVQTAATHTATLDCHRLDYTDATSDVLHTIILRPNALAAMGLRIQIQSSQRQPWSTYGRNIALEVARSATLPATTASYVKLIGMYSRDNKSGFSTYYSTALYYARAKLWLFGDGIYVFDEHDTSESSSWAAPLGGRTWDKRRETGSWYIAAENAYSESGEIVLTKAGTGEVKRWGFSRSLSNNRLTIQGMSQERSVKATEYWDIVSSYETRVGGPGTMTLTC